MQIKWSLLAIVGAVLASSLGGCAVPSLPGIGPSFLASERLADRSLRATPVNKQTPARNVASAPALVRMPALYPAGSIVIVNAERALYLVAADGAATRYPVAIGKQEQAWTGVEFVTDKKVNPSWSQVGGNGQPTGVVVPGGDPANPLGARALYLGRTLWRIHGTSVPGSIGQAVSDGCIRMHNAHVADLYDRVALGTEVYVVERFGDLAPQYRGRKIALAY